jgi:hypothetical protein
MAKWDVKTPVKESILVRGTTLKVIVHLGMTKGSETENFIHFKNPFGLRVSLKKWPVQHYSDLAEFFKTRGEKISFPKALADAADRAGLMLDDTDGSIKVSISEEGGTVFGNGMAGEWTEEERVLYEGPPMTFLIPPKLIAELVDVDSHTGCEVSEVALRVSNEHYTYLSSLEVEHGTG